MKDEKTLSCRVHYFNPPIAIPTMIAFLFLYFYGLFSYLHRGNVQEAIFICIFLSFLIVLIFPFVIGSILSTLHINSEGVVEIKGYLCGLIRKKIFTPWSEFYSWELGYFFNPMRQQKYAHIKLYFKTRGFLRPEEGIKPFHYGEKKIQWAAFSDHLTALLKEVGLPKGVPAAERKKQFTFAKIGLGFYVLIFVLFIVLGVLSLYTGKINVPGLTGIALFLIIMGSVVRSWKKKK